MSNFWTGLILCARLFSPCHCENPTNPLKTMIGPGSDKKSKMIFQHEIQIRSFKTLWYYHLQSVLLPNSLKPQFAALRKYSDRKMKSSASNWNAVIGRRLNVLQQQLILFNFQICLDHFCNFDTWHVMNGLNLKLSHRRVFRKWQRKIVHQCAKHHPDVM